MPRDSINKTGEEKKIKQQKNNQHRERERAEQRRGERGTGEDRGVRCFLLLSPRTCAWSGGAPAGVPAPLFSSLKISGAAEAAAAAAAAAGP